MMWSVFGPMLRYSVDCADHAEGREVEGPLVDS